MSALAAVALFGALTAACHRQPAQSAGEITIEHEVAPEPARVGTALITLEPTDASGKPVTGAHVTLEGDMTHAGMGPVFAEAEEVDMGRYRASLQFSMPGDWVILVHLRLPNGQELQRQFDVKGVKSD